MILFRMKSDEERQAYIKGFPATPEALQRPWTRIQSIKIVARLCFAFKRHKTFWTIGMYESCASAVSPPVDLRRRVTFNSCNP